MVVAAVMVGIMGTVGTMGTVGRVGMMGMVGTWAWEPGMGTGHVDGHGGPP